jgi:hypothetical protein
MEVTKEEIDLHIMEFAARVQLMSKSLDIHTRIAMDYLDIPNPNIMMVLTMDAMLHRERDELILMMKGLKLMNMSADSITA